jgi:acrylyl-CoA reductase (NADPH)
VVAATGRVSEADYFAVLGADEVIGREQVGVPGKLLGKERWAGAVDTVGGRMLADVCMTLRHGGVVAACGMAGGMMVPASVAPFILRGVSLIGIESVYLPRAMRERVWRRLVDVLDFSVLDMMTREVPLAQAISAAEDLLAGRIRGRVVVTLHPTEQ